MTGGLKSASNRTRTGSTRVIAATVAALGFAVVPLAVQAQSPQHDVLFDTQTKADGSCPGMAWHVVMHPDRTLNGMVTWDGSKHMAHVTGNVEKDGVIKASAVEQGSDKSGTVTGTVHGNIMKASIAGTGTGCDNHTMNVPQATNNSTSG